jgi:carbamoyltransferase
MQSTYILGVSAFYHDSAAVLIRNGQIIAAAQEERFTRIKHDEAWPTQAIEFCLQEGNITVNELACVAFYDKPLLKFERLLETYIAYAPHGIKSFLKAMPIWLKEKLWTKDIIRKQLDYDGEVLFMEHHLSHAASAFFPSPFDNAAFLTLDGVGEWTTTSYGQGKGNTLSVMGDIHFPHSLGLLYSAITYYCGFRVNSGEYKLMGLAPYGEPKYVNIILDNLVDVKDDGSFRLNLEYFDFPVGLKMTNKKFDDLFGGKARKPEEDIERRHLDIARSIQEVTEEIVMRIAWTVKLETKADNLCLAGGVALNCVANGKLQNSNLFDNIWIQPAAGDAGGSVGAALAAWHIYYNEPRKVSSEKTDGMSGSYLGKQFSDNEIEEYCQAEGASYLRLNEHEIVHKVARLIKEGKVVGWFQGRMEFGPRALGNRSIIGDAQSCKMQKIMNEKIKFRESFRPFAPAVLAENVSEYFEIEGDSPYMLLVAPVSLDKRLDVNEEDAKKKGLDKRQVLRSTIPAVTHVDCSARVQTVNGRYNKIFYRLIKAYQEKSECSVIINTSFNVRGEPIVCTPQDAYECFLRTNMDYLVMENIILSKKEQPFAKVEALHEKIEGFVLD